MQTHKWDTVINRTKNREAASRSVFVLKAGEWMETLLCLRGGKRAFFWYYQAQRWGECSAKKNCYSHQLVGMGLLKHLSKEGFGREPLEFCHSQTLLFGMTMLAAGCTYLWEGSEMKFPYMRKVLQVLVAPKRIWMMSFFFSVIKAPPLTWYYEVTEKRFCVLVSVYLCLQFSTFLLKCLMESCVTILLHSVLDCLCVGGPGQCSCLMLSWQQEDQTIFLSFLWKLETWLLSYQDSCFGPRLSPHYCRSDKN